MNRPKGAPRARLFDSSLSPSERRVYGAVTIYTLVVFTAMIWPLYSLAGKARPLIFGLPPSLVYLAALLISLFLTLLALFLWEERRSPADG